MPKSSKKYPRLSCSAIGCPFVTINETTLRLHTELGICDRMKKERKRKASLEKRMSERRLIVCPVKGCLYQTYYKGSFDAHRIVKHPKFIPGVKRCNTCGVRITGSLSVHMRRHAGIKPFACDFDGCDKRFTTTWELKKHEKTHTIEGQIRQKKQENRLKKMLEGWGYNVDCETTIRAKMGECLTDTQRHFSRLDFRIVNCANAVLLVECDENSHYWYELSCEMSRMADVRASLTLAGYTLPIYWIRYSPCGKYMVGSKEINMPRPAREEALKKHLAKVCSPDFTPTRQESVHYMFYDLVSKEEGPVITKDPEFPAAMKSLVSW